MPTSNKISILPSFSLKEFLQCAYPSSTPAERKGIARWVEEERQSGRGAGGAAGGAGASGELSAEQEDDLREMFARLDADGDGRLTQEQLQEGLEEMGMGDSTHVVRRYHMF